LPEVEVPGDEPEPAWADVGAAYEAALARDLGREAPPRREPPRRPTVPPPPGRRPAPPERDRPAAVAETPTPGETARPRHSLFPVWACLPLAVLLWVASLTAGQPLVPREAALAVLLGLTLLLQFRLWDELEDPDDTRPLRAQPALPRGPLQLLLGLAVAWNAGYLAFSHSWPLLAIFVGLSLVFLLWNKGLRRLFPGPVAAGQVA